MRVCVVNVSFACAGVQVLTSLEEAQATASEREGEARAKYNFNAQTGLELTLSKVRALTFVRDVTALNRVIA